MSYRLYKYCCSVLTFLPGVMSKAKKFYNLCTLSLKNQTTPIKPFDKMVKNRVLTISLVIHLSLLDWTESSDVINNFGIETKQGSQLSLLYKKLQDPTYQCSPVESVSQEEMGPDIFVNAPCDSTGVNVIIFCLRHRRWGKIS
jgi:hypothetical protein